MNSSRDMQSKAKIILVLGIIGVGGGVLGYVLLGRQEDKIIDWEVYQDEEYKFEISYPAEWEQIRSNSTIYFKEPEPGKSQVKISITPQRPDDFENGKSRMVYEIDYSHVPEDEQKFILEGVRSIAERRLKKLGAEDVKIYKKDAKYIIIESNEIQDSDLVTQTIAKAPNFEFQELKEEYRGLSDFSKENPDDLFQSTSLNGTYLAKAELKLNPVFIDLTFNEEGAKMLRELTLRNLNLPLALVLDGKILSAPTIGEAIEGGTIRLQGLGLNPQRSLEFVSELVVMKSSPGIKLLSNVSCTETGEEQGKGWKCEGETWSEDGETALDISPKKYIEIERENNQNHYSLSLVFDSEDSKEFQIFSHMLSTFRFLD